MGVRRRYYEAFAQHLAGRGLSVLTFDYRGMGESRLGSAKDDPARMDEWGLDIAAAIDFVGAQAARSITIVGHSAGGQVAGLAPNLPRADRLVFVASQSGYWRHWPGIRAWGLLALWMVMPVVARARGSFPSRLARLGSEDLPRGVAEQWAGWGRHPRYLFGSEDLDLSRYRQFQGPLLAYSLEGDHYAPRRAVEALLREYPAAKVEHRHLIDPTIGHFGFFRRSLGEAQWDDVAAWIQGTRPA
jgi:predicted alpha/beta hydrolase